MSKALVATHTEVGEKKPGCIRDSKKGNGKDVDLYSASHAPGTSNAHLRH